MILSSLTPNEVQNAIVTEDIKTIQSIKGIGTKTAQRVILELKDKMHKQGIIEKTSNMGIKVPLSIRNEALSALLTLGINKNVAERNINQILQKETNISLENLIKLALKTA